MNWSTSDWMRFDEAFDDELDAIMDNDDQLTFEEAFDQTFDKFRDLKSVDSGTTDVAELGVYGDLIRKTTYNYDAVSRTLQTDGQDTAPAAVYYDQSGRIVASAVITQNSVGIETDVTGEASSGAVNWNVYNSAGDVVQQIEHRNTQGDSKTITTSSTFDHFGRIDVVSLPATKFEGNSND